jgi:hypothetical protein
MGEALHVVAIAVERGGIGMVAHLGEAVGLLGERGLERDERGEGSRRRLPDRGGVAEIAVLVEQRDAKRSRLRHGTAGGALFAGEQAEERGLAGAIAPDDSPTFAFGDCKGDITEQGRGAEFDAHARKRDLGHSRNLTQGRCFRFVAGPGLLSLC